MTMRVTGDEGSLYVDDHDSLPAPRPPETEHRYLSENHEKSNLHSCIAGYLSKEDNCHVNGAISTGSTKSMDVYI